LNPIASMTAIRYSHLISNILSQRVTKGNKDTIYKFSLNSSKNNKLLHSKQFTGSDPKLHRLAVRIFKNAALLNEKIVLAELCENFRRLSLMVWAMQ